MKKIIFILLRLISVCVLSMGGVHIASCCNDKNTNNGNHQQSEEGDKDFTFPEIDF